MSAFDYSRTVETAERLITRYGQLGFIRRTGEPTGPDYDPTPGVETEYAARFVVTEYDSREIDGSRIRASDKKVLLSVKGLTIDPTTSDLLVEHDGSTLSIVDADPLKPAETIVLWTLQARRG